MISYLRGSKQRPPIGTRFAQADDIGSTWTLIEDDGSQISLLLEGTHEILTLNFSNETFDPAWIPLEDRVEAADYLYRFFDGTSAPVDSGDAMGVLPFVGRHINLSQKGDSPPWFKIERVIDMSFESASGGQARCDIYVSPVKF